MRRYRGAAAGIAGAMLATYLMLVLEHRLYNWVMTDGIRPLTAGLFSVLLMGLVSLAACMDGRQRCRRGGPALWWHPVARSFAGAGLFSVVALLDSLPGCLTNTPDGWWNRSIATSLILRIIPGTSRVVFLAATLGVLSLFMRQGSPDVTSLRGDQPPCRVIARFLLLISLVGSLWVEWIALRELGPDVLWSPFGYRGMCGYIAYFWYRDLSGFHLPSREVFLGLLDLFSQVALLLWLCQCLWLRIMKGRAGHSSPSTPAVQT